MYGFLNVCTAAALVQRGATENDVVAVFAESSPDAFQFDDEGMGWRGHRISTNDLAQRARRCSARSGPVRCGSQSTN